MPKACDVTGRTSPARPQIGWPSRSRVFRARRGIDVPARLDASIRAGRGARRAPHDGRLLGGAGDARDPPRRHRRVRPRVRRVLEPRPGLPAPAGHPAPATTVAFDVEMPSPDADADPPVVRPSVVVRWSPVETLRDRDFASYTAEEFDQARRLMADLRITGRGGRSPPPPPTSPARTERPICAAYRAPFVAPAASHAAVRPPPRADDHTERSCCSST